MRKLKLDQHVALLANVGVILSLVFVGVQIHQSAQATRSATILQLKSSWAQLNLTEATSPDLAHAFDEAFAHGWKKSSFTTRSMIGGFYRTLFHNWSDAYYQYRTGMLDEEQWQPYMREMKVDARYPLVRDIWADWGFVYDDSFRKLMDGFIRDAKVWKPADAN